MPPSYTHAHTYTHHASFPSHEFSLSIVVPVDRGIKIAGGLIRSCKLIMALSSADVSASWYPFNQTYLKNLEKTGSFIFSLSF